MNLTDVAQLPPMLLAPVVAELFDTSTEAVYRQVRLGQWPTPVCHLGRLVRFPTAPILDLLGIEAVKPASASLEHEQD